jgi:hypothetical protein
MRYGESKMPINWNMEDCDVVITPDLIAALNSIWDELPKRMQDSILSYLNFEDTSRWSLTVEFFLSEDGKPVSLMMAIENTDDIDSDITYTESINIDFNNNE